MRSKNKPASVWLILLLIVTLPAAAHGGVPEVNHIMVTDVTTVSFSVIWATSEASTASLEVFEDEAGTIPVTAAIEPHPVESGDATIAAAAQNNGVMKVRVTGLEAGTIYYFQTISTSISTNDTAYYPGSAPFRSVQTELETVRTYTSGADVLPFSNDVIIKDCYLEDGTTPAEGSLLIATVKGANHPVTAFVGDGVAPPAALIDLNNVFSRDFSENLDLQSGENLTLVNFRGMSGYSIVTHEVPDDLSMCEVKPPADALKPGWNMFSLPLEPTNTNLMDVIQPIYDKIESIWAYDAVNKIYSNMDKSLPEFWWSLSDLESTTGYWFVMNETASLKINCYFDNNTVQLQPGWNLVGSKFIETKEITEAIDSISDKINSIWYYNPADQKYYSYDISLPDYWNTLFTIEPGKSYWFVMNDDCAVEDCLW